MNRSNGYMSGRDIIFPKLDIPKEPPIVKEESKMNQNSKLNIVINTLTDHRVRLVTRACHSTSKIENAILEARIEDMTYIIQALKMMLDD